MTDLYELTEREQLQQDRSFDNHMSLLRQAAFNCGDESVGVGVNRNPLTQEQINARVNSDRLDASYYEKYATEITNDLPSRNN